MDAPAAIRWSQGMFLLPQHFQQSDLFHDAEKGYLAAALQPFPWGVHALSVDVAALENEIFRVISCETIFPDGLVVRYPEAAELKDASFKEALAPTMDTLGVYLCVATLEERDGALRRFVPRSEQRRDLYDAESSEATIQYSVPRAEIVFTNDPQDRRLSGFQSIKVAEVQRTGLAAPRYQLSKRYIPPMVRCEASVVLMREVRQVHEQLCSAARVLGQYRRERGAEALVYGVGDIAQLLALQALNNFIPSIQHLLAHGGGHPFTLYSLLAAARGALTTFSPEEQSFEFPEYVHTDLAACFLPLTDSIRRLLELLLPTHYEEVKLERMGSSFYGEISEALLRDKGQFVLAVRGPGSAEDLRTRVSTQAKISSTSDMRRIIQTAVRGVPTRYLEYPPAELPRLPDYSYFGVDSGHTKWKTVGEDGDISFYLPDAEPEVDVRLFVVLPRGRQP
jgi:type VI secretion system protein ImpJ